MNFLAISGFPYFSIGVYLYLNCCIGDFIVAVGFTVLVLLGLRILVQLASPD